MGCRVSLVRMVRGAGKAGLSPEVGPEVKPEVTESGRGPSVGMCASEGRPPADSLVFESTAAANHISY